MAERAVLLPSFTDCKDEAATVGEVLCKVGDRLKVDDDLIEIVTDKTVFVVPCPAEGIVKAVHVAPQQAIKSGDPVATLDV